jgi:hypothetical protein
MMSRRPRPTTVSPITAPERKATWSPSLRLRSAPAAVRLLARVAVFIPNQPARPEKNPPEMKAKGTQALCTLSAKAITAKSRKMTTKNAATTLYCCRR